MSKKEAKDFECPCCLTIGQWENIDQYRVKKAGMCMCKRCGLVQYPDKYKTKEEIKKYYRTNYRPGPQASNLYTGERKLQYHSMFLSKLFKEWKSAGKEDPIIGEIGSAYGLFLNWVKQQFPKADINGTELTESYRRVAYHEYGIKLTEDLDETKKYDLLVSYHVLEHMLDPHLELKKYFDLLKDDGVFYISVPIWFRDAYNSAMPGFDVEVHWATDHINCWSEAHLEFMFNRAGFEITYKNDNVYGNTYLLKKNSDLKHTKEPEWDFTRNKQIAAQLFKCFMHLQENETAEAIEAWPNCPTAWSNHYEFNRQKFDKDQKSLDDLFKKAIAACPNTSDVMIFVADILSRYERYHEALDMFGEALKRRPNNDTVLMGISNCYRMLAHKSKDAEEKKKYLQLSINTLRFLMNVSTQMLPQAISWSYQDQSNLPID